jgi:uncharacterized SAM-binding protein YcdF (DUF218 family)
MNEVLWPKVVGLLLTPPAVFVIVGLIGLFLTIWRRWLGGIVVALTLALLFVLSVPMIGKRLLMQLEIPFRSEVITAGKPLPSNIQAIVILGGGRYAEAPEYGGDTVSDYTLERLRYGAVLARQTGLPVMVSGGSVFGEDLSEGELMKRVLENDFGVKVKWVEGGSRTTLENARLSKKILTEAGIRHVYLVTHAWHMPRAQWSFVEAGLDAVPAPTGFTTISRGDLSPLGYLPTTAGLQATSQALRERIGFYWYKRKRDAEVAAEAVSQPQPAN